MKILKNLSMALVLASVFAACSKNSDDTTPPPFSIDGLWEGKIGTGSATPSGQYAIKIKSGGTIERIGNNGSVSASGTWQMNGSNFTASYTYPSGTVVSLNGSIDKAKYKLTANWQNTGGETGTLFANKQ